MTKTPALARVSLQALRKRKISFNRKKVAATSDRMIAAQIKADKDTAPDITALPDAWQKHTRAVRAGLGMTQTELAAMLRISVATIRNWEQGRTPPDGAASALLKVLAREPKAVLRALHG
jgi:putative transcriptional regulator